MKQVLPLTILAWLAAISPSLATHYQVYLLGGQSNANGRADAAQLTAPLNAAQSDVRFYWHRTQVVTNVGHLVEDQWIDLAPGSGHGTGAPVYTKEFGSEVSFGRAMANAKPSEHIAIIKYSYGGTNLYSDWSATGTQYTTFVSTVQAALTALTTAGHTYELRGMLWQQGEADTSGSAADNYQTNLTNLIERVRTNLNGGVAFPFVIGSLSNSQYGTSITTPGQGAYKVRLAQEAVAAADTTVGIVITDGYSVRSDVIHFDHNGQVALGQAFAVEMRSLEVADLTGPQLTGTTPADGALSTPVDSNLVITFNESVVKGLSGDIVIKQDGGSVFETIAVTDARVGISGSVVTINPLGTFALNQGYHVQIASGAIKDLSGNAWTGIADTTSWNFTTAMPGKAAGTTGVFDENTDATNALDVQIPASTLAAFKTSVLAAYNNNLGGVIDWETGVTAVASSGSTQNNTITSVAATYGTSGGKVLGLTFDRNMAMYTNDINSQVQVLSRQGAWHNALIPDGGNDPIGLEYKMSFSGADVIELGAAMPSRSTYALNGVTAVNFRATVTYSASAPAVLDFSVGGVPGTGDTFLHFAAPSGETITSFGVKWISETGGTLANGQRRPILDDLGFIVAAPTNTFATWITGKPGVNGQAAVNQDPDGDGIDNGVENFFGTEPGAFSQGLFAGTVSGNTLTFTHPLNANPADDLTATYRWSTDLETFHDDGDPNGAGTTTVTFSDPTTAGGERFSVTATITGPVIPDKLFVDVVVTQP